ncbi:hypothetical protein P154DRAFT_624262 [Amniculicola lignicola CBS 123094]|uniref:Uncharacterized protein n=1 Tax=Amniculicola lignicola CBS 123094 TaxID=1392246 RepID=A0A6A5W1L7_9PLEO|nr:hypothetical protein P154DRAFT_624262 [Amniculicola lignicola CBS 123094]
MKTFLWLATSLLAYTGTALPNSNLARRWNSYCPTQTLPQGTWYRAVVKNFHRFDGTESNEYVKSCYYSTQAAAEAELRQTCARFASTENGCYLSIITFDPVTIGRDGWASPRVQPRVWSPPTSPNMSLAEYHPGCYSVERSRTPQCVVAMHRSCIYNEKGSTAIPQEVGRHSLGFLCTEAKSYEDVKYSDIPNCKGAMSQFGPCYSSVHQYCDKAGHGGVGIVQELGVDSASVACIPYASYQNVKMTTLQSYHSGCNSPALGQSADCASAVHRYCFRNGRGNGGVVTELGKDEIAVGCIKEGNYVEVNI